MSPEAQRIAIAEACGWLNIETLDKPFGDRRWEFYTDEPNGYPDDSYQIGSLVGRGSANVHARLQHLPDYLNDLNAMRGAVETLRDNQFHYVNYSKLLFRVVTGKEWSGDMGYFMFNYTQATAAQRAEAFLKVTGKWQPTADASSTERLG